MDEMLIRSSSDDAPLTTEQSEASGCSAPVRSSPYHLLTAIDAGTWDWNIQTGALSINERWAEIIGYKRAELEPISIAVWQRFAHPADLAESDRRIADYLSGKTPYYECKARMLHKDGHWVWVLDRGRVISRLPDGTPERMMGIHLDITALQEDEDRFRAASNYTRSLIEASLDPLMAIDVDGKITDVNQAAVQSMGLNREQLIGSPFISYFTDKQAATRAYQSIFVQGQVNDFPLVIARSDGEQIEVQFNASLYRDEAGEVVGAFATAHDVTQLNLSQRRLESTVKENQLLSEMSSLLQSCSKPEEAFPIVTRTLQQLLPRSMGRCFMIRCSDGGMEEMAVWGGLKEQTHEISPVDCWALRRGRMHEFGLPDSINPPCALMQDLPGPHFCVPLQAQGQALGVIQVSGVEIDHSGRTLDTIRQLLAALADMLSLALANLCLRMRLQELSLRDPLTGLYNRRFMEEELERAINRSARDGKGLAIAMLDLDHFKQVNDVNGHDIGDAVLKAVTELMQDLRQGSDIACRYGGEEFVLVLTDIDIEGARARLERLRESIAALQVPHKGERLPRVTLSIGLAHYPEHGEDPRSLLRVADLALYRAKDLGRNRLELAEAAP